MPAASVIGIADGLLEQGLHFLAAESPLGVADFEGPVGQMMSARARLRAGPAVVSGGVLALAFPGIGDHGWLAFGALVPLGLAIERVNVRGAAALGAASGLTFWLAPIPCVAPTRLRYGGLSWPLAVLILLELAGYPRSLLGGVHCAPVATHGRVPRRPRSRPGQSVMRIPWARL